MDVTTLEVNGLIEEELLQCERSAYIGASREIDSYYEYLKRNYPAKKWYQVQKTMLERPIGFTFRVWRESRLVLYIKLLMQAGIYRHVSDLVNRNATIFRERKAKARGENDKFRYTTPFKEVELGDSIQTIFIMLVTCLALCSCVMVFEHIKFSVGKKISKIRNTDLSSEISEFVLDLNISQEIWIVYSTFVWFATFHFNGWKLSSGKHQMYVNYAKSVVV